ncbi:hypothetical protein SAMN05880590_1324 [Rhizobium sp. RU35A]|nr:hypothetical protein SAMN05880590_1324 [Rhizobium sp. RU35A]
MTCVAERLAGVREKVGRSDGQSEALNRVYGV